MIHYVTISERVKIARECACFVCDTEMSAYNIKNRAPKNSRTRSILLWLLKEELGFLGGAWARKMAGYKRPKRTWNIEEHGHDAKELVKEAQLIYRERLCDLKRSGQKVAA